MMVARSQVGGLSYDELAFADKLQDHSIQNHHLTIRVMLPANWPAKRSWVSGCCYLNSSKSGHVDRCGWEQYQCGFIYYLAPQVLDHNLQHSRVSLRTVLIGELFAAICKEVLGQLYQ
jgi:hypothetical protein